MFRYIIRALLMVVAAGANGLGAARDGLTRLDADRGQLGIFMVLIFGAVALVVVSIVLLFGMDIAGDFANGITDDGDAFTTTENFTASSSGLFNYAVNRQPETGDTVSLNDDETVFNETANSQLTEGTDYEFYPDNGTLQLLSANNGDSYNITYTGDEAQYAEESFNTVDSTGDAFSLFGTSVLVIPAAAVLAVLIGGLVGAVAMVGSGAMPGMGGRTQGGR